MGKKKITNAQYYALMYINELEKQISYHKMLILQTKINIDYLDRESKNFKRKLKNYIRIIDDSEKEIEAAEKELKAFRSNKRK